MRASFSGSVKAVASSRMTIGAFFYTDKGDTLTLATGEMPAGTAHNGLVTVLQTHNKVMATAVLGRLNDFFVRCALVAHTDVFHNRGVK